MTLQSIGNIFFLFWIHLRLISGRRNWIFCDAFGKDLQHTATQRSCLLDADEYGQLYKSFQ